jgi:hypothetical protein
VLRGDERLWAARGARRVGVVGAARRSGLREQRPPRRRRARRRHANAVAVPPRPRPRPVRAGGGHGQRHQQQRARSRPARRPRADDAHGLQGCKIHRRDRRSRMHSVLYILPFDDEHASLARCVCLWVISIVGAKAKGKSVCLEMCSDFPRGPSEDCTMFCPARELVRPYAARAFAESFHRSRRREANGGGCRADSVVPWTHSHTLLPQSHRTTSQSGYLVPFTLLFLKLNHFIPGAIFLLSLNSWIVSLSSTHLACR